MTKEEFENRLIYILDDVHHSSEDIKHLILDLLGERELPHGALDLRIAGRNELRQELRDIVQGKAIDSK